jgi:hypothetical protein
LEAVTMVVVIVVVVVLVVLVVPLNQISIYHLFISLG